MPIGTIERAAHLCSRIRNRLFTLLLSSQFKEFGTGTRISPPFRFYGLNQMSLGEGVMINRDCWLQTIPGCGDADSPKLIIKSYASIGMGSHIAAAQQVVIGEYVMLGRNNLVSDHLHGYKDVSTLIAKQGIDGIKPVSIGRGSMLGNNVAVLPGVSIGEHCVIGVNSVVSTSIPDFSVAIGMPARVVQNLRPIVGKEEK